MATKKTVSKSAKTSATKKVAKKTAVKKAAAADDANPSDAQNAVEKAPKTPTKDKSKSSSAKTKSSLAASILGRPSIADRQKEASKKKQAFESIDISQIKPEWVEYFRELIRIREQISAQLSGHSKESAEEMPGYSLHMADSGTDNFDRDFNLSLMSSEQDSLYEIDEALKRIEKGTYGICELTDKPIPKARLQAVPWTRFTVEAQSQLERNGEIKQKRLGTLGTLEKSASSSSSDSDDDDTNFKSNTNTKDKD